MVKGINCKHKPMHNYVFTIRPLKTTPPTTNHNDMYHAESVEACKETMTINTYSITIFFSIFEHTIEVGNYSFEQGMKNTE